MIATTVAEVTSDLRRFGRDRWTAVRAIVGTHHELRTAALVAIGHVESNLQNVVTDGGHGRGWLQVDDRFFQEFLRSTPGCPDGTWKPAPGHNALSPGYSPTLEAAVHHALTELHADYAFAREHGFTEHAYMFMLSAYNAGAGGAIRGWREAEDTDRFTTPYRVENGTVVDGYARRVIERRDVIFDLAKKWGWGV